MREPSPIFRLDSVETHFPVTEGFLQRERGRVRAVDGVSFDLRRNEILGLVGESGSGKSTVARTLIDLDARTGGTIEFDGQSLGAMDEAERRAFKRRVQMVFQDTESSFDPRMTIGDAIREPMMAHGLTAEDRLRDRVEGLLEQVGLTGAFRERYPHQLSGGEKQRAALARALSLDPEVLILDEPVSALDVSVQAQILELIEGLQQDLDLAILLITHDMAVVRRLCTRVAVMYLGEIVELRPTEAIFTDPDHPYTRALVEAIPRPDPTRGMPEVPVDGAVPDPSDPPPGCRFHTRCPAVIQPADIDLAQSTWRSIYDLRVELRDGQFSLSAIQERLTTGDGQPPDSAALAGAIRDTYDIPRLVPDSRVENAISETIDRILEDEFGEAAERLAATVSSVCEREVPTETSASAGRVSCHLHPSPAADGESATDPFEYVDDTGQ